MISTLEEKLMVLLIHCKSVSLRLVSRHKKLRSFSSQIAEETLVRLMMLSKECLKI
eukprot:UN26721